MKAQEILEKYINFFKKQNHIRIANASLVPENDPTTLFTSSGMQPLVPFLLGQVHPHGKRLVNVQNCFRAQDIEEVGDNRHTTFFRMLGNWSLGDYFKQEQIPWFFEFLTDKDGGLGLDPKKLYVTVFSGFENIPKDTESIEIWKSLFEKKGVSTQNRIFEYGVEKNWWSRSGTPEKMPTGEPGGPDSEMFYDFGEKLKLHEKSLLKDEKCHVNCDCGRYLEIGNSVFMQFKKSERGFEELAQRNVDFGGGLERLVAVTENKQDIFQTSLLSSIIRIIEQETGKDYASNSRAMRIIADHLVASVFITAAGVLPSNKEQGHILRRLIRRGLDNFYILKGKGVSKVLESIVEQNKDTDPVLVEKIEEIKNTILEEERVYQKVLSGGKKLIEKEIAKLKDEVIVGDELMGVTEISAETAFKAITSFGLGQTQLKSLGYIFDEKALGEKIKEHQSLSRKGAEKKFAGGLADQSEKTIMGHTATHLLHKALRDMFGESLHQAGSNITPERVRFDYNFDRKLTLEEIKKLEDTVNEKIKENLPVRFEIMPLEKAKEIGAIGLFDDKYADNVKIYFIGEYSTEFCGGPHVDFTGEIKRFKIVKEEALGRGMRRIYAILGE